VIVSPPAPLVLPVGDLDVVEVRFSVKRHGDFHLESDRDSLTASRQSFVPGVWSQPNEVHGVRVREVHRLGDHDGAECDALVTGLRDAVLGIWVGDCVPVALVGDGGRLGGVHAGWRGAQLGVLQAAARAVGLDAPLHAYVGPCIHPCCYEFGERDLAALAEQFGASVIGATGWGTPALDMPALVAAALSPLGVTVHDVSVCTGCNESLYFSHRRRAERGRQVMAVWKRSAR